MGLSAIAKVLLERGYVVSGSDLQSSAITRDLTHLGATIYEGHRPKQIGQADLVVVSSAVSSDNVEVLEATRKDIPVIKRAEMLGRLMASHYGIAVAGTHGKTTTTAMIAFILEEAGFDPTFIVGGILRDLGTNAKAGRGPHFVVEADEYDRTFLGLSPSLAVVTSIEMDHPDCYKDLKEMTDAFAQFLNLVPQDGCIIGWGDGETVRELKESRTAKRPPFATYGFGSDNDWRAVDVATRPEGGNDFTVLRSGAAVADVRLNLPGRHNVANALASLAAMDWLGINLPLAAQILGRFRGTERRFEIKGTVGGVTVIDDYAHHPTEIRATLAAVRERFPGREIWAVFQPHTYSRTKALLDDFAASLGQADHVIVTDIFPAREHDDLGVSAADIVSRMDHPDTRYIAGFDEALAYLGHNLRPTQVLVTLGAGDIYQLGERLATTQTSGREVKGGKERP